MDAGRSVTVPRVQFPSEPSSFPSSARSSSASSPRHGAAPFHHQLRRAIRIAEDAEAGVEAGDPDISRAIKQLEKHVTISASAHKSYGSQPNSQPQSQPQSQPGSLSNSLPGSQTHSGYNTPSLLHTPSLTPSVSRPMSPPSALNGLNGYVFVHTTSPISASAGGSAAPTRPVSAGNSFAHSPEEGSRSSSPRGGGGGEGGEGERGERELHMRVREAALQRARDVHSEAVRCSAAGQLYEARDLFAAAEAAYRDLHEKEAAEEVAAKRCNLFPLSPDSSAPLSPTDPHTPSSPPSASSPPTRPPAAAAAGAVRGVGGGGGGGGGAGEGGGGQGWAAAGGGGGGGGREAGERGEEGASPQPLSPHSLPSFSPPSFPLPDSGPASPPT